jgi:predicted RNase H-like HicB family nuclease
MQTAIETGHFVAGKSEVNSMTRVLLVRVDWDPEAKVWVAASEDVPGLATEAATVDALMAKLEVMIPELLELNGWPDQEEVPFELLIRRFEITRRRAA